MRVVSWNIGFRGAEAAKRQGRLLRDLAPDLMLLQELNPQSSAVLADAARADLIRILKHGFRVWLLETRFEDNRGSFGERACIMRSVLVLYNATDAQISRLMA